MANSIKIPADTKTLVTNKTSEQYHVAVSCITVGGVANIRDVRLSWMLVTSAFVCYLSCVCHQIIHSFILAMNVI